MRFRDAGIAAARRLAPAITSYFIDAQADSRQGRLPIGGLTVIRFPNSHLQYAITWFALAIMTVGAYIIVMRQTAPDRRT